MTKQCLNICRPLVCRGKLFKKGNIARFCSWVKKKYHRIIGLERTSGGHLIQPHAQRVLHEFSEGLAQLSFESSRMEIQQPLWATCSSAWPLSWLKNRRKIFLYLEWISHVPTCICCLLSHASMCIFEENNTHNTTCHEMTKLWVLCSENYKEIAQLIRIFLKYYRPYL